MQVYRLGPKSGDTSDRNWEATTLNNKCWVLAESEADARQKVALATGIGPRLQRGATIPKSPWINRQLTDCVPDNSGATTATGIHTCGQQKDTSADQLGGSL